MRFGRKRHDPERGWVRDPVTGAGIKLSEGGEWTQVDTGPGRLTIAVTPWKDTAVANVRPNVTLASSRAPEQIPDVQTMASMGLAEALAGFDDAHVMAYDVWPHPEAGDCRSMTFTYTGRTADGLTGVIVEQYFYHHNGWITTLTATCGIEMARAIEPYTRFYATNIQLPGTSPATGPSGEPSPAPSSVSAPAMEGVADLGRPRCDTYLATVGVDLEDLGRIAALQPYQPAGPALTAGALDLLRTTPTSDPPPQFVRELLAAELCDGTGSLTDSGRTVQALLDPANRVVTVEAFTPAGAVRLEAFAGPTAALVVAGPSPTAPVFSSSPDDVSSSDLSSLDLVDHTLLPGVVASWLGIAPAWALAVEPDHLPRDLVRARLEDSSTPAPDGANSHLNELWRHPWSRWTLTTSAARPALEVIAVTGRGQLLPTPTDRPDQVQVQPFPSLAAWQAILEELSTALLNSGGVPPKPL